MRNLWMTHKLRLYGMVLVPAAAILILAGCTGAQRGAGYGGAAGAGLGAIIGHQSGEAGAGAIIGAGAGALIGAIMGDAVEESQQRRERERQTYSSSGPSENIRYEEVQVGFKTQEVVEPVYVPPKYKYVEYVGHDDDGNEYHKTERVLVEEGHYENRTVTKEVPIYERIPVKVRN